MREYHIHIDAEWVSDKFEKFLIGELQFLLKNFTGFPANTARHAPERHFTYKVAEGKAFNEIFDALLHFLANHPDSMSGYIEGEFIPGEVVISAHDFNPNILPPFKLELGRLPEGKFREDEIHITLDRDNSDPRLISSLRQMGFFSVYMDKDYGTAEIFTTQGSYHDIQTVLPLITNYLNQVGGSVNCVIKEERIVRSWMSAPDIKLPPVITSIQQLAVAQPTHPLCVR